MPVFMYTHPYLRKTALIYRALGNERRLKILELLSLSKRTGMEIVKELGICQSAVSRHMQLLFRSGLIVGKRVGAEVNFSIADGIDTESIINRKNLSR